jgi:hypothetical protein
MALTGSSLFGAGKRMWRTDGPNYVRFSSDNTAFSGFLYCVRVYRGTGVSLSTPAAIFFYPANPSGDIIIDVGEIISQQMRYARLDSNGVNISRPQLTSGNMFGKTNGVEGVAAWVIECREGYNVSGSFAIQNATAIGVVPFMIKGGFSMAEFNTPQPPPQFLTMRTRENSPWIGQRKYSSADRIPCIPTDDKHLASFAFINDNGTYVDGADWVSIRYTLYSENTELAQETFSINSAGGAAPNTGTASDKLLWLGCGLRNIESSNTTSIPSASKPSNHPNWTHYVISAVTNTSNVANQLCFFRNDCWAALNNQVITLRWSNSLGGYEHYTFDKVNVLTMESERKEVFTQGMNYTGTSITPTPAHHGRAIAANKVEQTIELKTGMLSVAERKFLQTIIQAQHIYVTQHGPAPGVTSQIVSNLPCVLDESSKSAIIRENFSLDTFTIKLKPSYDIVNNI